MRNGEQGDISSWKWPVATKAQQDGETKESSGNERLPHGSKEMGELPKNSKMGFSDPAPGWGRGQACAMVGVGGIALGSERSNAHCFKIIRDNQRTRSLMDSYPEWQSFPSSTSPGGSSAPESRV